MKRSNIKRISSDPRKKAIAALDRVLSKMVRERDKDEGCITCGKDGVMDCGHFIRRECMSTRFNPMNVNAQCRQCNHFLSGNLYEYALRLDAKYYGGTAWLLRAESKSMRTWTVDELNFLTDAARKGSRVYNQAYEGLAPLQKAA
jgi:hypothetical protein